MAVKFGNGIDLEKTALMNALVHPVGSDPSSPADGQVWYRSDTDRLHLRANGVTRTVLLDGEGGGIANIVEDLTPQLGGQLDVNGFAVGDGTRELLAFVEDAAAVNHLEIENEATGTGPILRATGDDTNVDLNFDTKGSGGFNFAGSLAVTGTVDGRDVSVDGGKLDGIEAGADVTDAANVAAAGATMDSDTSLAGNGWFLDEDTFVSDSATKVPSQQSTKAYIASQVAGFGRYQGGYNAATNTPDLDTAPVGVKKGDQYTVDTAGTFFAVSVEAGDLLIAEIDNPAVEANWTIVNRNLDQASTAVAGISRYATQAEANARSASDRAVTPASMADFPRKFVQLIGNGALTAIVVTHNLGTKAWTYSLREAATDNMVETDRQATTTNTATFTFAVAPATNALELTMIG